MLFKQGRDKNILIVLYCSQKRKLWPYHSNVCFSGTFLMHKNNVDYSSYNFIVVSAVNRIKRCPKLKSNISLYLKHLLLLNINIILPYLCYWWLSSALSVRNMCYFSHRWIILYPYTIKRMSIYKSTILSDIALINQILFNYMIVEILNHYTLKPELQKWSCFGVAILKSKNKMYEFSKNHELTTRGFWHTQHNGYTFIHFRIHLSLS